MPARIDSLATARRWIRDTASHLPQERLEELALIVSELVLNSVNHAA